MSEREHADLQSPDMWDFERAERRAGVKEARAVVSVAFARPDFERVADAAEKAGQRTSEFIREAALERVARQSQHAVVLTHTGTLGTSAFTGATKTIATWKTRVSPASEKAVTA